MVNAKIVVKLPDKEEELTFSSYEDLNTIWRLLETYDKVNITVVSDDSIEGHAIANNEGPAVQIKESGKGNNVMNKEQVKKTLQGSVDISKMFEKALKTVEEIMNEKGEDAVQDVLGSSNLNDTFLKDKNAFLDRMAQDAVDAELTEEELKVYPDEWLSWLKRL